VSLSYVHERCWTHLLKDSGLDSTIVSTTNAYVSSDPRGAVEISTLRVRSSKILQNVRNILDTHWKIKNVLFLLPLNGGFPKCYKMGLQGDLSDSVRFTAYAYGAICDKAVYSQGMEHWRFLFGEKEGIRKLINDLRERGRILEVIVTDASIGDVKAYDFRCEGFLTSNEMTDIRLLYSKGFFDIPRRNKLDEIAKEINISKATLSETSRRTLRKIVECIIPEVRPIS